MIASQEKNYSDLKIVLMGDSKVGKTTLLTKYFEGEFISDLDDTLQGINLFRKKITKNTINEESMDYYFNIWDITGSDNYLNFITLISEEIDSVIIQTNADDRQIEDSLRKWLEIIKRSVNLQYLKYLIISTRNNLPLDKVILRNLLLDYDLDDYFIIDSKNTKQVNGAFETIFNEIIKTKN